jgi:large subunit ribosomal protein L5e
MYKKAHLEIKKDPEHKPRAKATRPEGHKQKRWTRSKLSRSQRKDRVKQKKESFLKKLQASD